MPQDRGRVRVQREAAGHRYDSDGFYHVAKSLRRLAGFSHRRFQIVHRLRYAHRARLASRIHDAVFLSLLRQVSSPLL